MLVWNNGPILPAVNEIADYLAEISLELHINSTNCLELNETQLLF